MADAAIVLVDTSVWVRFFQAPQSIEAQSLDLLLSTDAVATCAPIRAEIVSGAKTRRECERLRDLFGDLRLLKLPEDIWRQVEETCFALARRGWQVAIVDVLIAVTAWTHQVPLWTLDQDFRSLASMRSLQFFSPKHG